MSELKVPTMAEMMAAGEKPDILFWVGCSGSFDDRAKKITKAIIKILNKCEVKFAVLGTEESCTGDPAKRAGNEFLFQMQAMMNIQVLDGYEVKKINSVIDQVNFNLLILLTKGRIGTNMYRTWNEFMTPMSPSCINSLRGNENLNIFQICRRKPDLSSPRRTPRHISLNLVLIN